MNEENWEPLLEGAEPAYTYYVRLMERLGREKSEIQSNTVRQLEGTICPRDHEEHLMMLELAKKRYPREVYRLESRIEDALREARALIDWSRVPEW